MIFLHISSYHIKIKLCKLRYLWLFYVFVWCQNFPIYKTCKRQNTKMLHHIYIEQCMYSGFDLEPTNKRRLQIKLKMLCFQNFKV